MAQRRIANDAQDMVDTAIGRPQRSAATRRRRNRNRRRRRARRRAAQEENVVEEELKEIEEEEEMKVALPMSAQPKAHEQRASLLSLLNPETRTFCEAVIHPFGQEGVGAMLPDGKGDSVLAGLDRWSYDLPPTTWDVSENEVAIGACFVLLPRCLAVGWLSGVENPTTDNFVEYTMKENVGLPATWLNSDLTQVPAGGNLNSGNGCIILMFGILNTGRACRIEPNANTQNPPIPPETYGVNYVELDRTQTYNFSTENTRLLGGGLKVFSDEAPIETGGTVYGGQISPDQLYPLLVGSSISTDNGLLGNLETKLLQRKDYKGIDGTTVRYNPFQDPSKQLDFVKSNAGNLIKYLSTDYMGTVYEPTIAVANNLDPSSFDQIAAGTLVPAVVWKWDVGPDSAPDTSKRYTLRVNARVHLEGTPSGNSPFITHKTGWQPGLPELYALLNNKERFPTVSKGQSFKSFFHRVQGMISTVSRYSAKAGKIAKVVEDFL